MASDKIAKFDPSPPKKEHKRLECPLLDYLGKGLPKEISESDYSIMEPRKQIDGLPTKKLKAKYQTMGI